MDIFENPGNRFRRLFPYLFPVLFAALLCTLFYVGISHMQSLSELLTDYHITYDMEKFVVEYIPNGSNLLPSISVLPLKAKKGGLS